MNIQASEQNPRYSQIFRPLSKQTWIYPQRLAKRQRSREVRYGCETVKTVRWANGWSSSTAIRIRTSASFVCTGQQVTPIVPRPSAPVTVLHLLRQGKFDGIERACGVESPTKTVPNNRGLGTSFLWSKVNGGCCASHD